MASTNKTTNYELSQFQSSDIPAWLTDYNGDMQKIDAGIHAAKVQAEGAANGVSALQTTVSGKQDRLTFDDAPTQGSSNPVKSGGVYAALQNVSVQTDAVPTAGSTNAVQSGGVYSALQGKQNALTFDDAPTPNSNNPVKSGGIYDAISAAGGVILLPVYDIGSGMVTSNYYAFKIGRSVVVHNTNSSRLSITKSSFTQVGSRRFYARTMNQYIPGNPLNLTAYTENSSEWLNDSNKQSFVMCVTDDTNIVGTVIVSARFDGTNTRFIEVISEDLYNQTWVNLYGVTGWFALWLVN